MYLLVFYVPVSHTEEVKNALFARGAGNYGLYDHCSWEVVGSGQFRPLRGSHPLKNNPEGMDAVVEQSRVELIVNSNAIKDVINELKKVHPYEQPVYFYWEASCFISP